MINQTLLALALQCAPNIHPETTLSVIQHESTNNPLAINVNYKAGYKPKVKARSKKELIALTKKYVAKGHTVDVGYGQINSANFKWLGVTVEEVVEPCVNIQKLEVVLLDNYKRQLRRLGDPKEALKAALSQYNTGSPTKGTSYVGYIKTAAKTVVPSVSILLDKASVEGSSSAPLKRQRNLVKVPAGHRSANEEKAMKASPRLNFGGSDRSQAFSRQTPNQ